VAQRLHEAGEAPRAEDEPQSPAKLPSVQPSQQRVLMYVEANVELQNIVRERLKSSGYRVLVTRDPDRALGRFAEDAKTADCAIFSTGSLGESALEAFNRLGQNKDTQQIPAILLLDEQHPEWKDKAHRDQHRVVLAMPIKIRQLRELVAQLVPVGEKSHAARPAD
jgi:serine/threonine-protein kinase